MESQCHPSTHAKHVYQIRQQFFSLFNFSGASKLVDTGHVAIGEKTRRTQSVEAGDSGLTEFKSTDSPRRYPAILV